MFTNKFELTVELKFTETNNENNLAQICYLSNFINEMIRVSIESLVIFVV